jgi:hypothetical protein
MPGVNAIGRNFGFLMVGFAAVLLAGFWIPYFSGIPHFDSGITAAVHLHAAALFCWTALMLIQPVAIYGNAYRMHRTLGTLSLGVIMLVVVTSITMLHKEYLERIQAGVQVQAALKGEYLSAAQLLLLVSAYVLSIVAARRREIDVHWRLIFCIILLLLPAGLARTLGYWFEISQANSQSVCIALNAAALVTLTIHDIRAHKRWAVYALALSAYIPMAAGWFILGRPV